MNLLPAGLVEGGIQFGTQVLPVDRSILSQGGSGGITVGVRPEDLEVSATGHGLQVEVDLVEELGADGYLYGHADVDGGRTDIVARVDGRVHPNAGERVFLTPQRNQLHIFDAASGARLGTHKVAPSGAMA
jgi:multiple sugar transport system ATP-binding protein